MAEKILVDKQVKDGMKLVQALDDLSFQVKGALWYYYPDMEDWKLVIATPKARELIEAYTILSGVLTELSANGASIDISQVKLVQPDDAVVKGLGGFLRMDGLNSVRFTHNMINGIYVDDALIYRLAA